MFNALRYTKILEEAGFTKEMAEKAMFVIIEVMNDNFTTKNDLERTRILLEKRMDKLHAENREEFAKLRGEISSEFAKLRGETNSEFAEVRGDMKSLENRMTIKLGSLMVIGFSVMTTILKLL
jgi:hypothetical protein